MNRDGMLDAAEEVVLRDGIGRLTLDAVAREATLSKGGLMHHFPTKDALIDAMVRRKVDGWRAECNQAIERQPAGPGRVARALIDLCLADDADCGDSECRRCFVLVAALVHDPTHVAPLRDVQREMVRRAENDGLPPGLGDVVHLAMNGLWFDRMFGLSDFDGARLRHARRALLDALDSAQHTRSPRQQPTRTKSAGAKTVAARPRKKTGAPTPTKNGRGSARR